MEDHRPDAASLPLVLLPGTLCDARIFAPLQQRISSYATQVILTPQAPSLQQAAAEVLTQAPERFVLLGFSLGGMVAMEAALRAPGRVRGLILLSTTPLPVPAQQHAARRASVAAAQTMPMQQFVREQLWPAWGGEAGNTCTLPLLQRMADQLGQNAFAAQTESALARLDFRPRLAAIRCPTLILAGTDDLLCPPAVQRQLAEALPHSTSVMLPGAVHFALTEQADEVAAAVAAWLDTLHAAELHAGMHPSKQARESE